jgi:hypothetical protein
LLFDMEGKGKRGKTEGKDRRKFQSGIHGFFRRWGNALYGMPGKIDGFTMGTRRRRIGGLPRRKHRGLSRKSCSSSVANAVPAGKSFSRKLEHSLQNFLTHDVTVIKIDDGEYCSMPFSFPRDVRFHGGGQFMGKANQAAGGCFHENAASGSCGCGKAIIQGTFM